MTTQHTDKGPYERFTDEDVQRVALHLATIIPGIDARPVQSHTLNLQGKPDITSQPYVAVWYGEQCVSTLSHKADLHAFLGFISMIGDLYAADHTPVKGEAETEEASWNDDVPELKVR